MHVLILLFACRDEVLEYMKSSDALIEQLLQVLMKGLNVNKLEWVLSEQTLTSVPFA